MDEVRSAEWMTDSQRLRDELDATQRRAILWGMRRNPAAMNGLRQQTKRAARGFRTAANSISIADLRLGKLTHLPITPSPRLSLHARRATSRTPRSSDVMSTSTRKGIEPQ